jgi:two-component system, OmpR family, sensor kinase
MYADLGLLGQAFGNLLSNAVKYSPDKSLVQVIAGREGAWLYVAFQDCGIGIPEADRQRVFERYYRGSNTSGIVGSGVGLYLVKAIVDLHKGSVGVESGEGAGSRFSLRLPTGHLDGPRPCSAADGDAAIGCGQDGLTRRSRFHAVSGFS